MTPDPAKQHPKVQTRSGDNETAALMAKLRGHLLTAQAEIDRITALLPMLEADLRAL